MNGCEAWKRAFENRVIGDEADASRNQMLAHQRSCAACAHEAEAWRGWRERLPSADPEAAQTRRVVAAFLARPMAFQAAPRNKAKAWPWLGAAVCCVVAVAAFTLLRAPLKKDDANVAVAPSASRVVMAAGDAGGESETLGAGARLEDGAHLNTRAGRLCFTMSGGILVCLGPGSRAVISETERGDRRVDLSAGLAVAWLRPQAKGTSFIISTADGQVKAVGTHFAVQAREEHTQAFVHLFHGEVEITGRDGGHGRLVDRGALALAHLSPLPAANALPAALPAMLELGGLLDTQDVGLPARLDVLLSKAAGDVFVDTRPFGPAPLSLLLSPGHHSLRIEGEGKTITDEVTLGGEDAVVRTYELPPTEAPVPLAPPKPEARKAAPLQAGRADPARLLVQARTLRASKSFEAAAHVYRRLWHQHAETNEARLGLVLLGDLQLTHLRRPNAALASFDTYLRLHDPRLASEAAYGRIKALGALGRHQEQARAVEEFLAAYPQSLAATTLRSQFKKR